jgi:hypothetical protein
LKTRIVILILISLSAAAAFSQQATDKPAYPKTVFYTIIHHPLVSLDDSGFAFNFSNKYAVAFPFGINHLISDRIGFSIEIAPSLLFQSGTSKMDNVLFHPGILFRFKKGFTIATRVAFETVGRYGITFNFSKVLIRRDKINFFTAVPFPIRLGNGKPVSIGAALQLGIAF